MTVESVRVVPDRRVHMTETTEGCCRCIPMLEFHRQGELKSVVGERFLVMSLGEIRRAEVAVCSTFTIQITWNVEIYVLVLHRNLSFMVD